MNPAPAADVDVGMPREDGKKLRAYWSKDENDLIIDMPLGHQTKSDGRWLAHLLGKDALAELTARGYDVKTLRFEIAPQAGEPKFAATRPEGMTSAEAWHKMLGGA